MRLCECANFFRVSAISRFTSTCLSPDSGEWRAKQSAGKLNNGRTELINGRTNVGDSQGIWPSVDTDCNCKSVAMITDWTLCFNTTPLFILSVRQLKKRTLLVVEWLERLPQKRSVCGSNPAGSFVRLYNRYFSE